MIYLQSPSSVTTDSGSINDEVDNNETEQETNDSNASLPQPSTNSTVPNPIIVSSSTTTAPPIVTESQKVKVETIDEKPIVTTTTGTTVPIISSSKPSLVTSESPLNVSIRLPDDINERKNLIKRNIEHSNELKDVKFNTEPVKFNNELKKEIKVESVQQPINKNEKDIIKEEMLDIPEKFKTELIIPKVVTMDKVIIKEEQESSNEAINMNMNNKEDNIYKENLFMPQNMIKEPTLSFGLKEQHLNNHLPPNHSLIMKDTQNVDRNKEMNLSQSYMKEQMKNDQFPSYHNKEAISHPIVKIEPRDEPIELTNPNKSDIYNQPLGPQPLNIPTVIPISQQRQENHFDEDKRIERNDKLERPERLDRPDLSNIMGTSIGQPPLPSLMQSGNLVTIGGQQSINPYSYMAPTHYNPHSPRNMDKNQMQMQQLSNAQMNMPQQSNMAQNEPQNLKIKQEIPDSLPVNNQSHLNSLPPYSQNIPPTNMSISAGNQPQGNMVQQIGPLATLTPSNLSQSNYTNQPQSNMNSVINDPLQSLKDVKVPGYNLSSTVPQPSVSNERPSSGPTIDNIKKEPDYVGNQGIMAGSPAQPPTEKSPAPKNNSNTPTPGVGVSQTPPLLRQQGTALRMSYSTFFLQFFVL